MKDRAELFDELAAALERLLAFKPTTRSELDRWYALARSLESELVKKDGLSPEVPSLLWNYLADADIRFRDAKLATLQTQQIRLLTRYLKRGEMPSDEELRRYA